MTKPIDFIFFGGAFNPPHIGHLELALFLNRRFEDTPIHIAPNTKSPFKGELDTSFEQRLEMCELLFKAHKEIIVSNIEGSSPVSKGYTIDTLEKMIEDGVGKHPALVIGDDQLADFEKWHRWKDIIELSVLIIFPRTLGPGEILDKVKLLAKDKLAFVEEGGMFKEKKQGFYIVGDRLSGASSTNCRKALSSSDESASLLTPEVAKYIQDNNLYEGESKS